MKTANALNVLLAAALVLLVIQLHRGDMPVPAGAAPSEAAVADGGHPAQGGGGFPGHPGAVPGGGSSSVDAALAAIRAVSAREASFGGEAAGDGGGGFREFDLHGDFEVNPFTFFTGKGLLLCAGSVEDHNAMTIGWGGLGTIWRGRDAVTVYVAQSRHTRGYMDAGKRFTVMAFDPESQGEILAYMGSHSGRDGDKDAALGLHVAATPDGTPYYEEARLVLECELMYAAPFDPAGFREIPAALYADFPAGIHTEYIGHVVRALKRFGDGANAVPPQRQPQPTRSQP